MTMLSSIPSDSRIEYLYRFFEDMPDKELHKEMERASLEAKGSRKQMISKLRNYYREGLVGLRRSHPQNYRTENLYDYLIAIDFECTCEKDEYEYDHEIIEFPAVLVSVRSRRIIDTFRVIIRPKDNPTLTAYCTKLTGITQEMVDKACSFPEALLMFRRWMAKHGLDGIHNKGNCRRFCYVTDGPWDVAKFFQPECLRWGMQLPHDFRIFLNIRRAFINFYCRPRPGNPNPTPLPVADLSEMLKRLDLTFEGKEHCGLDDTGNIARILIQMLHDGAELRVNEKLVNGAHLLRWHTKQLVFTDEGWAKRRVTPPSAASVESDECLFAEMAKVQIGNSETGDGKRQNKWWERMPYKVVRITRKQFLGEQFLECESCDEVMEEEEEEEVGEERDEHEQHSNGKM